RYNEVESHNLQIHYALGAGYELPWYGIRIGATGMMVSQIMDVDLRLNVVGISFAENELYDTLVHVEARQDYIPTAVFGVSARPLSRVILSLSYQLAYDVTASGTAGIEFERGIGTIASVTGENVDVNLKMPAVFRAAAQYRHSDDSFDVELAFVWEGWRRNDVILFVPQDIVVDIAGSPTDLQDITVDVHARDTGSLRLGGQYRVLPQRLTVRAGVYYERAAVGGGWLNSAFFDLDKIGATLGARVDLPLNDWIGTPFAAWLDLAGGYALWSEKTVETSKAHIGNPLAEPGPAQGVCGVDVNGEDLPCWPVANGSYKNKVIVAMASLGVWFDI
ncbi:MAG: outer membrane protein transport protein, partial [Myxococcota bacterium]